MNLDDEVICGHPVTAERKRINAVFLDLIQEFDRLCKACGVTWWMMFGGLIGAVRHKGFIPWDDDIDVAVPRKDFDRLLSMTNAQFGAKDPYFLQNPVNDPGNVESLLRFRRSDTTCIRPVDYQELMRHETGAPYNMGLCLAIFPIDEYPRSPLAVKAQVAISGVLTSMMYRAYDAPGDKPFRWFVCHTALKLMGPRRFMSFRHWPYRWCRKNRSGKVQSFGHYYSQGTVFDAADFSGTVLLPFEDIEVPAPAGYDRCLRATYGDYMILPPPEQRFAFHGAYESWDTPYLISAERLRAGEITLPEAGG